jgi:poly-beta-hydroxyalkanoate depolymerase
LQVIPDSTASAAVVVDVVDDVVGIVDVADVVVGIVDVVDVADVVVGIVGIVGMVAVVVGICSASVGAAAAIAASLSMHSKHSNKPSPSLSGSCKTHPSSAHVSSFSQQRDVPSDRVECPAVRNPYLGVGCDARKSFGWFLE